MLKRFVGRLYEVREGVDHVRICIDRVGCKKQVLFNGTHTVIQFSEQGLSLFLIKEKRNRIENVDQCVGCCFGKCLVNFLLKRRRRLIRHFR